MLKYYVVDAFADKVFEGDPLLITLSPLERVRYGVHKFAERMA